MCGESEKVESSQEGQVERCLVLMLFLGLEVVGVVMVVGGANLKVKEKQKENPTSLCFFTGKFTFSSIDTT